MTSLLPWAYSKLTMFERCPKLGRAKYITKELPYVESEAARLGNEVHDALEKFINNAVPLPEKWAWVSEFVPPYEAGDTFVAERWFNFNEHAQPTPGRSWFTTKIDLLQIEDEDIAWIIDWKTGRPWEDPDQLNIYSTAIKAHYPRVRHWRGMYVWLKERKVGEVHTLSPAKTFDGLVERVKAVETGDIARKNKLCPWCELTTCKYYTGEHSSGR